MTLDVKRIPVGKVENPSVVTDFLDTPIGRRVTDGDCWLAGGAPRRAIKGDDIGGGDYDLFFPNETKMGHVLEEALARDQYEVTYTCPEGDLITVQEHGPQPREIQMVGIDFFDTVADLIDSFDFTITMAAVDASKDIVTTEQAIQDILDNRIRIHKVSYPVATMRRVGKYEAQGYHVDEESVRQFVDNVDPEDSALDWSVYAID